MVCNDCEVRATEEKEFAFLDSANDCETFELDNRVVLFSRS